MKPLQTRNEKPARTERRVTQDTERDTCCEPRQANRPVEPQGETLSTICCIEDKICKLEIVLNDFTNKIRPILNSEYLCKAIDSQDGHPVECLATPLAQRLQNSEQRLEKVLTYCNALIESASI